jgi:hypothetical protein
MVESAFVTVAQASQQAWDGLMQDLLQLYRSKLQQLEEEQLAPRLKQRQGQRQRQGQQAAAITGTDGAVGGDLMLLSCSRLQGLVVLCADSDAARAATRQQMEALDPASEGVQMAKVKHRCLFCDSWRTSDGGNWGNF